MSDKYKKKHVFLISDKRTVMNLLLKTSILHFQSNATSGSEIPIEQQQCFYQQQEDIQYYQTQYWQVICSGFQGYFSV